MDSVPPAPPTPLAAELFGRINVDGPLRFDAYMESVLYDPRRGFYATGGRAGARAGDFLTSPEVGPLFGAVMAAAVDRWWLAAGSPATFTVVEAGAGPGTLAASVRLAQPACAGALRWIMVERTAAQRVRHVERLGATDGLGDVLDRPLPRRSEPELVSVGRLPAGFVADVVVANELLDNLPTRVMERTGAGWAEVWVDVGDVPGRLTETLLPLADDDEAAVSLDGLVPAAPVGTRVPFQQDAARWLDDALSRVGDNGTVVVIDYADTTASMGHRGQQSWMRTYSTHGRGAGPLQACGAQDLTVDVAVDQLALVRAPTLDITQAAFLADHGIDMLVEEGRRVWSERAHIGDLAAVRARSRVREAEALCDPSGLGAHRVLGWGPTLRQ